MQPSFGSEFAMTWDGEALCPGVDVVVDPCIEPIEPILPAAAAVEATAMPADLVLPAVAAVEATATPAVAPPPCRNAPFASATAPQYPESQYQESLAFPIDVGFADTALNLRALDLHDGNRNRALRWLRDQVPQSPADTAEEPPDRLVMLKRQAADAAYTPGFRDVLMIQDEWNAYEQSSDERGERNLDQFPTNHGRYMDSGRLLGIRGTFPFQYAKIRKTRAAVNPGAQGELFLYVPLYVLRRSNNGTPIEDNEEELESNLQDCVLLGAMENPVTLPVQRGAGICWITLEREIARDLIQRNQLDPEGRGEFVPTEQALSLEQKVAKLGVWPTDGTMRELTALYGIS